MTFHDDFARALVERRGGEDGGGSEPAPLTRHSELGSESPSAEREPREILNQVQDDDVELNDGIGTDDDVELNDGVGTDDDIGLDHGDRRDVEKLGRAATTPPLCSALDAEPCATNAHGLVDAAHGSGSSPEHNGHTSPTPKTRHDGWTPEIRVKFLNALANCGNVRSAALYVGRSRTSAYNLYHRDPDFARGWDAALLLARDLATDELQCRAIDGVEEEVFYHGNVIATRRRYDSRLLLAHIARLDKLAENVTVTRAAARFGELTDAIAAEEDTAPLIAEPTAKELAEADGGVLHTESQEVEDEPELAEFYECIRPDIDTEPDHYVLTRDEAQELCDAVPGMQARLRWSSDPWIVGSGRETVAETLAEAVIGKEEGAEAGADNFDLGSVNHVNLDGSDCHPEPRPRHSGLDPECPEICEPSVEILNLQATVGKQVQDDEIGHTNASQGSASSAEHMDTPDHRSS